MTKMEKFQAEKVKPKAVLCELLVPLEFSVSGCLFFSGPSLSTFQLAHPYRAMVLRAMETVLSGHIHKLDKNTASAIILLASNEMTRTKVGFLA